MLYIDYQFYTDEFKGVSLSEDVFSSLVGRASDMIDQVTNYKIESIGFDNLFPAFQQRVKKATAAQVEYLHVNGGMAMMQSSVTDVSIGKFSYDSLASSKTPDKTISDNAMAYLKCTGLLYRGVATCG
ncbi:hypothetical protein [Lysinibacillus sp. RS5]|uniref:hypothetical protein n=1 Tax=unclassified Lysinibacillus TaxID=2636778 RepID=UPI0035BE5A02